jgi:hypothetical protein
MLRGPIRPMVRRNQAVLAFSQDEQGQTGAGSGTVDAGLAALVRVSALLQEAS